MGAFRGHILNGRVVIDDPMDLPDGTEVQVAVIANSDDLDDGDDLDDADRARLHAAILSAEDEINEGQGVSVEHLLASLATARPR